MKKSFIFITTQFEGYHKYENAPIQVNFLKNLHRHLFHVKVYIQVFDDDREIEFFIFKRFVDAKIEEIKGKIGECFSCEMFSDKLHKLIQSRYANRQCMIEISEDGENGSYKEYSAQRVR